MKTNSYSTSKVIESFEKFFDKKVINRLGKSSDFARRRAKKITPYHFVAGFIMCCCKNLNSFSGWAVQIGLMTGQSVSRQAVFERLYKGASAFAEKLLQHVVMEKGRPCAGQLFEGFGRVVLQDSTTLRLPDELACVFKGNTTGGQQKSQVRIQTTINVKTMRFSQFMLGSFTQNDQSASGQVLDCVNSGDLTIRDLGYFAIETFEALIKKKVHFLSRLKYGVTIYSADGRPLELKRLLRHKKVVDMQVLIGKKQLPVRLVMLPLPKAQVAERIRKAKTDRDKRLNHSREYYQWLGFSVFITTVDEKTWSAQQAGDAYKVRWQIEIIFKSWKSGANMRGMIHENIASEERVKTMVYLFLLFMCLVMHKMYISIKEKAAKAGKVISMLKLIKFVCTNFCELVMLKNNILMKNIIQHCCYDIRHDRENMIDLLNNFKN